MVEKNVNCEEARVARLLRILQDIRLDPVQSLEGVLKRHKISRSQFYKDRSALASIGFRFEYRKESGFRILEDRLSPITGLSLSDRVTLLFALESLSASGDGVLAARAIELGRKLVGGLESPFCEQLLECFDKEVTEKTYGVKPEIFQQVAEAVRERRRVKILYLRSGNWQERWRTVDPKRIYMRDRILYLYARTVDEKPHEWKVFRLNRIRAIELTGMAFKPNPDEDDGFCERQKNAFFAFIGADPKKITVKFTSEAIPYIRERKWHHSQVLESQPDGSLLFTVCVADPEEVVRWSRQFGQNAQVVEIETD